MFLKIKEIWFYLKAYLKYFSYEGKISLNKSKTIFKKLFFFRKLIRMTASGVELSIPAIAAFLNLLYFMVLPKKIFISLINIFFLEQNFLKIWYTYFSKIFFKSLKFLKIIFKI